MHLRKELNMNKVDLAKFDREDKNYVIREKQKCLECDSLLNPKIYFPHEQQFCRDCSALIDDRIRDSSFLAREEQMGG